MSRWDTRIDRNAKEWKKYVPRMEGLMCQRGNEVPRIDRNAKG